MNRFLSPAHVATFPTPGQRARVSFLQELLV